MPNQEFVCTFAGHRQVFESKIEKKNKKCPGKPCGDGQPVGVSERRYGPV